MTREQRLEVLVTSLCLAGTNVLRHPMKPATRQMLRADIAAARAYLREGIEPEPAPDPRPAPPARDLTATGASRAAAAETSPDYWWTRYD